MSTINETQNMRLKDIVSSYGVYVSLFVGTGFLSGAIVHFPIDPVRFLVIGVLGALIFTVASTLNESLFHNRTFKDKGVFKVILFSLLLSIGIGMISGGFQHFDEFPIYGSYLIPFGILLSMVAYIFKSNIHLFQKQVIKLAVVSLLIITPLGLGLNAYAKTMKPVVHDEVGGHSEVSEKKPSAVHSAVIHNDQDFLANMIPHHEEAVTSSQLVLSQTTDPELKKFLQGVIEVQSKEIAQMKQWHKEWFGTDSVPNSNYQPMMGDLTQHSGKELERAYIAGMIDHHKGAIQMAKDVLPLTNRTEVKAMANNIVTLQEKEVSMLNGWLQTKYQTTAPHREDDGHEESAGH